MAQISMAINKGNSINTVCPRPLANPVRKTMNKRLPIMKNVPLFAFILSEKTSTNVKQATHQKSLTQ